MPRYTYTGQEPLIFGDLHYGDNASVDGVTGRDGEAVVLISGDVVTTTETITHAFLMQHTEGVTIDRGSVTPSKKSSKADSGLPTRGDSVAPETPADASANAAEETPVPAEPDTATSK